MKPEEDRATPLTRQVAEKVRALRKERRLSGTALCERMREHGITSWAHATVSKLETGRRAFVTLDELHALAKALDVPIARLLPNDPDEQPPLDDILRDTIAVLEALREGLSG